MTIVTALSGDVTLMKTSSVGSMMLRASLANLVEKNAHKHT